MVSLERFDHFLHDMQARRVTVLLCGVRPEFAKAMANPSVLVSRLAIERFAIGGERRRSGFNKKEAWRNFLKSRGLRPVVFVGNESASQSRFLSEWNQFEHQNRNFSAT
jgi:hypothetical protein